MTGIVAPAGTPKEIVDQLQRDIAKIVAPPDIKTKLDTLGFRPVANTRRHSPRRSRPRWKNGARWFMPPSFRIE